MTHPLKDILQRDPRYPIQAYEFVRDALSYAHEEMGLGATAPPKNAEVAADESEDEQPERHLTGQELCEAGRRLALEQYGMMAKIVLNSWGIESTSDIGEIVYNMINIDLMRKSPTDRREDFDDVFDFQKAFRDDFDFAASMKAGRKSAGR
jgi:uncharacterized repeat protein (TIGR04138 family)